MNLRLKIIKAIATLLIFAGLLGYGWYIGRTGAFDDIISEKCWLDKESRDIICIEYMGD